MEKSDGLTKRKKGSLEQDLEVGAESTTETVPSSAAPRTEDDDDPTHKDPDSKDDSNKGLRICLWILAVILIIQELYNLAAPMHVKAAHKKAMDKQLVQFAKQLAQQKAAMTSQAEELSKSLAAQKEALLDQFSIVSMDHHKEEMGKLESEKKKLDKEAKEKVAVMQASIDKTEAELKKLKEAMQSMKPDTSRFCPDCTYNVAGLHSTCGKRRHFLTWKHKTPEAEAMEAVMKMDPNCVKK